MRNRGHATDEERKLADELFKLVEADQGFAYVSDGMEGLTRAELIEVVRGTALPSARRVVRKMEQWLKRVSTGGSDG